MYWNDTMARKARMMVSKIRRKSRVRPYRERTEITPLLSKQTSSENGNIKMSDVNGQGSKATPVVGNGTAITIVNQLYPIEEDEIGKSDLQRSLKTI